MKAMHQELRSAIVKKIQLTPLALALLAPLTTASATTYYVSATGSDSNSGLSSSSPFKTLDYADGKLVDGDELLLKSGETFTPSAQIFVNPSRVSMSTYGGDARAIIDGRDTVPDTMYGGQLVINGDNVTISNITLKDSGGFALKLYGDNILVDNVYVHEPYGSGITIYQGSSGATVQNSEVTRHNWGYKYGSMPEWGAGIAIKGDNFTIKNNYVHHGWGEGINANSGPYNGLIENNLSVANRLQIYLDVARDIVVRNNILLGTTEKEFHRVSGFSGQGIILNNEPFAYRQAGGTPSSVTKNIHIYNNLIAFTAIGIGFWGEIAESNYQGIVIANNTIVDNEYQFQAVGLGKHSDTLIANNIFMSLSSPDSDIKAISVAGTINFKNNAWSKQPSVSKAVGSGDIYGNIILNKMTGWRSISSASDVKAADFAPVEGAITKAAGTTSLGALTLPFDYFKNILNTASLDIGAIQSAASLKIPPAAPNDFSVE